MLSKNARKIALLVLIAILVLTPVVYLASQPDPEYALEQLPRMLGMEGFEGEELIRIDTSAPTTGINGPFVETHGPAVSMDRDLRDLPQVGPDTKRMAHEMGQMPAFVKDQGPDPVIQTNAAVGNAPITQALAPAPAPSSTFVGLDLQNWGAGWPPDTHGDVGPSHYIQAVNTSIGIFDKATGNRLAAFTFNNFFIAAGLSPTDSDAAKKACATLNYGDPYVIYDQVSGRWIITDFAFAGSGSTPPYYECIAVSKGADPVNGGWWLYPLVADTASLNDYPKLGIWNDGIYMSANMFKRGRTYSGAKVWALNRDDLISGAPLRTVAFTTGTSNFSLLPANLKGTAAPAGTPEYFMSDYGSNTSMKLWKFTVNWATPSASTFTGPTSFNVASFTRPASNSVPQQGTTAKLDTLGDRLMSALQYRNVGGVQSLWVSRAVVAGSSFGIRWMEVRNMSTTPTVYQQGTYAPDALYRWMPSLAVDKFGNMAVGYSVSSSTMYPAIRYAGRLAGDALGTLGQTETTLFAGTGAQTTYNGSTIYRWGDYASMSVDPVDDCTFWFTTEYYATTGFDWQTRIGSFKLPGCP